MKTTVLALALALAGLSSLSAAPLKGNFLITGDSAIFITKTTSFYKGHASLASNTLRVTADEITVYGYEVTSVGKGVTVVTCRGVTSAPAGLAIPTSKELTLELDNSANVYQLNPAGIVVNPKTKSPASKPPFSRQNFPHANPIPAKAEPTVQPFSSGLPALDLKLSPRAQPSVP